MPLFPCPRQFQVHFHRGLHLQQPVAGVLQAPTDVWRLELRPAFAGSEVKVAGWLCNARNRVRERQRSNSRDAKRLSRPAQNRNHRRSSLNCIIFSQPMKACREGLGNRGLQPLGPPDTPLLVSMKWVPVPCRLSVLFGPVFVLDFVPLRAAREQAVRCGIRRRRGWRHSGRLRAQPQLLQRQSVQFARGD